MPTTTVKKPTPKTTSDPLPLDEAIKNVGTTKAAKISADAVVENDEAVEAGIQQQLDNAHSQTVTDQETQAAKVEDYKNALNDLAASIQNELSGLPA